MDREKVIKGLECHRIDNNHRINCADCPYYVDDDNHIRCVNDLHDDALALLKEQPEIVRCKDCTAWKQYDDMNLGECELYPEYNKMGDWFCNFGERK